MKMLLCLSHKLNEDQREQAKNMFGVSEFVELPSSLRQKFQQVPPAIPSLREYALPFFHWLEEKSQMGDLALIQGEFGLTYLLVQKAFSLGLRPLYATTTRQVKEVERPDGTVHIERVFSHKSFRFYENLDFNGSSPRSP